MSSSSKPHGIQRDFLIIVSTEPGPTSHLPCRNLLLMFKNNPAVSVAVTHGAKGLFTRNRGSPEAAMDTPGPSASPHHAALRSLSQTGDNSAGPTCRQMQKKGGGSALRTALIPSVKKIPIF